MARSNASLRATGKFFAVTEPHAPRFGKSARSRRSFALCTSCMIAWKTSLVRTSGCGPYVRKQNKKGDEVGGIVPHITPSSIANAEPPDEEILVDRPEPTSGVTRIAGPFTVEATIPTPVDWEGDGEEDSGADNVDQAGFVDRMFAILRQSPVLRLDGNRTVELKAVRQPAKTLSLSAEATVVGTNGSEESVELSIDCPRSYTYLRMRLARRSEKRLAIRRIAPG